VRTITQSRLCAARLSLAVSFFLTLLGVLGYELWKAYTICKELLPLIWAWLCQHWGKATSTASDPPKERADRV
jgi:hypothetical protein